MKKVFVAGLGGCVGHYLFDELKDRYEIFALVRNPQRLRFRPQNYPQLHLIVDDLMNIQRHAAVVKSCDCVVHLSADWGGTKGNLDQPFDFFQLLDPAQCQKVIYFSTASILGPDGKPLTAAAQFGTPYIRSKYEFYQKLPTLPVFRNSKTLFPTWVLGGDNNHPYSHATQGIIDLKKWLPLIKNFTVDARFHFIHARDLAAITLYLLENEVKERSFILGNASLSASQFIREVCHFYRQKVYWQIPIPFPLIQFLAQVTGRKLQPWDAYCFNHRYFTYPVSAARTFGLPSNLETVEQVLGSFSTI